MFKVLQDSLKKSNEVVKYVMSVLPYVSRAIEFANKVQDLQKLDETLKLDIGWYLRDAGHRWDSIFMLAIAQDYFNQHYASLSTFTSDFDIEEDKLVLIIDKFRHLNQIIKEEDLTKIHLAKPMLDGK